jgi:hypothetical protein
VCLRLYQPGVDPLNVQTYLQVLSALPTLAAVDLPDVNFSGIPVMPDEPPLRCYVFAAGC